MGTEINYKNDKADGVAKSYYESGQLHEEGNFKNGEKNGIAKWYFENGEKRYIDTYKNGQKINRKAYDRRGRLKSDQDYPYRE